VVDFISLHYEEWFWPAFNLADAAITAGASCWLIIMLAGKASPIEKPPVS
jgi:signal peptidase II